MQNMIREKIQLPIKSAIKDNKQGLSSNKKKSVKCSSDKSQPVPDGNMFHIQNGFKSLLPTMVWFIEQDPYTNVSMNLDVNFRCVHQQNFRQNEGENIQEAILEEDGKMF